MKKLALSVLTLMLISCSTKKETINNLDELLAKHFEASGANKLKFTQSLLHRDKLLFSKDGKECTLIEVRVRKPNMYYYKAIEAEDTLIYANNSKYNWIYSQGEYNQRPTESYSNNYNMYAYGFSALFFSSLNNWKMEYQGKEKFNNKELYRVKVIQLESGNTGRDSVYYYDIDPDTYLIARVVNNGTAQYFSDYKEVKGIKYASRISSDYKENNGESFFLGTIEEFQIDPELPDILFEPSGSILKKTGKVK